jgi:hypothetical protein
VCAPFVARNLLGRKGGAFGYVIHRPFEELGLGRISFPRSRRRRRHRLCWRQDCEYQIKEKKMERKMENISDHDPCLYYFHSMVLHLQSTWISSSLNY